MVPLVEGIYLHDYTITMQSYLFPETETYWIHVQVALHDRKKKDLMETNAATYCRNALKYGYGSI